jgi:hypothetical protein
LCGKANFGRQLKAKPKLELANLDRNADPPPSAGHSIPVAILACRDKSKTGKAGQFLSEAQKQF